MQRSQSYHSLNKKKSLLLDKLDGERRKDSIQKVLKGNQGEEMNLKKEAVKRGRKKDNLEKYIESSQPLLKASLQQLRHTILCESLPDHCPYRTYIWSILLRASPIESEWYSGVVSRGEVDTVISEKIRNDVFRTFQNNKLFWDKIDESEFSRILNVFAWCVVENNETSSNTGEDGNESCQISPYVQGMNVITGPILYVSRSEPQAFSLLYNLLTIQMPRYIKPNLDGAIDGTKLVDYVLKLVDPQLYNVLRKSLSSAKIYALPSVLTLCACTPELEELVKLWDFLFSYGIHLNIIFVVSQLILIREELISSSNPMGLLRTFPNLNASDMIKLTLSITKNIPDDLYDLIVRHTYDDSVSTLIDNYTLK